MEENRSSVIKLDDSDSKYGSIHLGTLYRLYHFHLSTLVGTGPRPRHQFGAPPEETVPPKEENLCFSMGQLQQREIEQRPYDGDSYTGITAAGKVPTVRLLRTPLSVLSQ